MSAKPGGQLKSQCLHFQFLETTKAFLKAGLRKAFEIGQQSRSNGKLLLLEELLYLVFVNHQFFVSVPACFGVLDTFYDFNEITPRTYVGGTLGNFCVL